MKKSCFLAAVVWSLLLTGCIFTPRSEHSSTIHDLQTAGAAQPQKIFVIESVSNSTPAHTKFFYRVENNTILLDHYRSWVQPPEQLLHRYLMKKFPLQDSSKDSLTIIKMTITAFEFDLADSEAVLSLTYTMRYKNRNQQGSIFIREKFAGKNADLMIKAMDKAVTGAADALKAAAEKFNR